MQQGFAADSRKAGNELGVAGVLGTSNPTNGYEATLRCPDSTYLLVGGGILENVVHQGGEDFGYSEYTGTVRAILGSAGNFLMLLFGQIYPFADYGVNEIKDA